MKLETGNEIRVARIRAGLTQTELARKLGVKQAAVACWENNYSLPRPGTMAKLCGILNIPLEKLIKAG